ncbi:MAG: tetratricopeptide repeat protein [Anaerolineales bacterium]|nr:tetratricopeptide repeat protein [Anaerolineales bacterium]
MVDRIGVRYEQETDIKKVWGLLNQQTELAWESRKEPEDEAQSLLVLIKELYQQLEEDHPLWKHGRGRYLTLLAYQKYRTDQLPESLEDALEAQYLLDEVDDKQWQARLCNILGILYMQLGDRLLATEYWLKEAEMAQAIGSHLDYTSAHHNLGWIPFQAQDYEAAVPYFQQTLPEMRQLGHSEYLVLNLCNLATCEIHLGEFDKASSHLEEAWVACTTADLEMEKNIVLQKQALLADKQGMLEDALAYYTRALAITETTPNSFSRIPNLQEMARLCIRLHQFEDALLYLEEAQRLSEISKRPQFIYENHQITADLYEAQGDFAQALEHYRQFHEIKARVVDEASERSVQNLRIVHQTETAQKEAELLKSQNMRLEEEVTKRTEELTNALEQRNQLAEQLVQALEKETELSRLKSRIITTVSHEFRTPLTVINTLTTLLARKFESLSGEKRESMHRRIQNAVYQVTELLQDVALVESITQATPVHQRPMYKQMALLCSEIENAFRQEHPDSFHVQFDYDEASLAYVTVDIDLFLHIVLRLLTNAMKYTPDDKPIVAGFSVQDKEFICSVRDQGVGIPADEQDKIFDLFYRAKTAEHIRGLGLGLYIVRQYVQMMEGEITVQSAGQNKGTTFTVRLPIVEE